MMFPFNISLYSYALETGDLWGVCVIQSADCVQGRLPVFSDAYNCDYSWHMSQKGVDSSQISARYKYKRPVAGQVSVGSAILVSVIRDILIYELFSATLKNKWSLQTLGAWRLVVYKCLSLFYFTRLIAISTSVNYSGPTVRTWRPFQPS